MTAVRSARHAERQVRGRPYGPTHPTTIRPSSLLLHSSDCVSPRKTLSKGKLTSRQIALQLQVQDSNQACRTPPSFLYQTNPTSAEANIPSTSFVCPIDHHTQGFILHEESDLGGLDDGECHGLRSLPPKPPPVTKLACADHPESRQLMVQCATMLQEQWDLPPDPPLPPGMTFPGNPAHHSQPAQHINTQNAVNPIALAIHATLAARRILTPPHSDRSQVNSPHSSDSGTSVDYSDDEEDNDTPDETNSIGVTQSHLHLDVNISAASQPSHEGPVVTFPTTSQPVQSATLSPPPFSDSEPWPSSHVHMAAEPAPTNTQVPVSAGTIPVPLAQVHQQHLMFFLHEVLRRSRTSCETLEIAMCYLGAIRVLVRRLLNERTALLRAAYERRIPPKSIDHRGVLMHPLTDSRRALLGALVLATKFHVDRAYANKAWASLTGLPSLEVTRCERALGEALGWRLWVGRIPPSMAELRGEFEYQAPQCGLDAFGNPAEGIVSAGRCMSPPPLHVDSTMLAMEQDVEDVQQAGVHSMYSEDGIPGERDHMAASFIATSMAAEESRQLSTLSAWRGLSVDVPLVCNDVGFSSSPFSIPFYDSPHASEQTCVSPRDSLGSRSSSFATVVDGAASSSQQSKDDSTAVNSPTGSSVWEDWKPNVVVVSKSRLVGKSHLADLVFGVCLTPVAPPAPRITAPTLHPSSIVGAFRAPRTPPPKFVQISSQEPIVWHPPPLLLGSCQ